MNALWYLATLASKLVISNRCDQRALQNKILTFFPFFRSLCLSPSAYPSTFDYRRVDYNETFFFSFFCFFMFVYEFLFFDPFKYLMIFCWLLLCSSPLHQSVVYVKLIERYNNFIFVIDQI